MTTASSSDPYLFLEEVDGRALAWIAERSDRTVATLTVGDHAELTRPGVEVLDATDRIAWPVLRGRFAYNVWKDSDHPRGLWRRVPWSVMAQGAPAADHPAWETLIDVDALARAEDVNWVYAGTVVRRPVDDRALIRLRVVEPMRSRSASSIWWSVGSCRHRKASFHLPEAKCSVSWVDEDTLLLARRWIRQVRMREFGVCADGAPVAPGYRCGVGAGDFRGTTTTSPSAPDVTSTPGGCGEPLRISILLRSGSGAGGHPGGGDHGSCAGGLPGGLERTVAGAAPADGCGDRRRSIGVPWPNWFRGRRWMLIRRGCRPRRCCSRLPVDDGGGRDVRPRAGDPAIHGWRRSRLGRSRSRRLARRPAPGAGAAPTGSSTAAAPADSGAGTAPASARVQARRRPAQVQAMSPPVGPDPPTRGDLCRSRAARHVSIDVLGRHADPMPAAGSNRMTRCCRCQAVVPPSLVLLRADGSTGHWAPPDRFSTSAGGHAAHRGQRRRDRCRTVMRGPDGPRPTICSGGGLT